METHKCHPQIERKLLGNLDERGENGSLKKKQQQKSSSVEIFDFPVMNWIKFLNKRQNEWTEKEMQRVSFYCGSFLIELYSFCRKSKITENQHNNSVDVEDDDVVTDAHTSISHRSLFSTPLGHSQSLSKVFVERSREFFIH